MAAKSGFVYAIANDAMPGLVKIGATTRDPMERLHEARACTWAPPSFRLLAEAATGDAFGTERAIHALLAPRRADARREFFVMTHDEARTLLSFVAGIENQSPAQERQLYAAPLAAPLAAPVAAPAPVAAHPSPEEKLRAWVEANYTRISLREKDSGTKLETLYTAYTTCVPPIHQKVLGRNTFAQMLNAVYTNIGPHQTSLSDRSRVYLLR